MALESKRKRVLFVVDVFDLAVVKKTEGDVLCGLENHVARFSGDSLKIHVKSLRVLFQEKIIFLFRQHLSPSQKAANCSLPIVTYGLVGNKIHFSNLSGLGVYEIARGDGMNVLTCPNKSDRHIQQSFKTGDCTWEKRNDMGRNSRERPSAFI